MLFKRRPVVPAGAEYKVDLPELKRRVRTHVALNCAQIDGFPLILSIVGAPGIGKTYNIRQLAKQEKIALEEISSSALAHHKEGMALFPLIRHYRDCSASSDTRPSMLLIDDFDRSIASRFSSVGHTIHSQLVVGFLMDLCDNPYALPDEERRISVQTRRVPIMMTGNDFSGLDPALTRPQRMTILRFEPTRQDKLSMMKSAFSVAGSSIIPDDDLISLEREFPEQSIAFFSDIVAEHLAEASTRVAVSLFELSSEQLRYLLSRELRELDLKSAKALGRRIEQRILAQKKIDQNG